MRQAVSDSDESGKPKFQTIVDGFLHQPGLPFAEVVTTEIANDAEQQVNEASLWLGRHAKLIDGFTFTMPDTETNQAEFPHPRTQKKGVGLPIARSVAIISLALATVMDVVLWPYKGKETGESALLRQMMASLMAGDVVFDGMRN